jgi:hypothetical protein
MNNSNNKVVAVVFSKNRPLQLDLALNSLYLNCEDVENLDINVIYKADIGFQYAYNILMGDHSDVNFIKESNFKGNVLHCLYNKADDALVLWLVDDTVITNKFNINKIAHLLRKNKNALGFSLRLGYNTKYCYSLNINQEVPKMFKASKDDIIAYCWPGCDGDFGYALEVSQSMYRINDLWDILSKFEYNGPNQLEQVLFENLRFFVHMPIMLCFETSVAFSNPLNKVQSVAMGNRANNNKRYSVENLLNLYEKGVRIDPNEFYGFVSESAHQEKDIL